MKGLEGGKRGERDWMERGDEISVAEVPAEVIAKFREHAINTVVIHTSSITKFRRQTLGDGVEDYILHFNNPVTRKYSIISVEVRNGKVGDAVTRE